MVAGWTRARGNENENLVERTAERQPSSIESHGAKFVNDRVAPGKFLRLIRVAVVIDRPDPRQDATVLTTDYSAAADAELAQRLKAGDHSAFGDFYDRFAPVLFSLVFAILGDRKESEDLLEETFHRMWKGFASYDAQRSSLFTWAVMIARHEALAKLQSGSVARGASTEDPLDLAFFRGVATAEARPQIPDELVAQSERAFGGEGLRLQEQAVLYALGLLEPEEAAEFEQSVHRNPELRALVDQVDAAAAELARRAPVEPLPAGLRARVIARAQPGKALGLLRRRAWMGWSVAALFALSCGYLLAERGRLRHRINHLEQRDLFADIRVASLGSSLSDTASTTIGIVLWDRRRQRGLLKLNGFAPNDRDHDYQLWLRDARSRAVDAGVFHLRQGEPVRLAFQSRASIRDVDRFEIRLARKGGARDPEGPVVMSGK